MSTLPIDLQVLFSKASEHSENIARHSNAAQSGYIKDYEKIHRESQEVNNKVNNMEEYAQDFTRINPESRQKKGQQKALKKKEMNKEIKETKEYKRAPIEEGTGKIIDIID